MRTLVALTSLLVACGGSSTPTSTPKPFDPDAPAGSAHSTTAGSTTTGSTPSTGSTSSTAPVGNTPSSKIDSPQITRSGGAAGGIVILWPRIPGTTDADTRKVATMLQERLRAMAARARPGAAIDVRPEPERVCPRAGCTAIAVGAAIMKNGGGCAVVATVTAGGMAPSTIVPWVGALTLKSKQVAFREPPESQVIVADYANCNDMTEALDGQAGAVEAAIKAGQ